MIPPLDQVAIRNGRRGAKRSYPAIIPESSKKRRQPSRPGMMDLRTQASAGMPDGVVVQFFGQFRGEGLC